MEVIPGQLVWAPESAGSNLPGTLAAEALCAPVGGDSPADLSHGAYKVHHYPPSAWGRAFGPLGLVPMLRFCHNLDRHIKEASGQARAVAVFTQPKDEAAHTNGSVLIGAYALLFRGWDVKQLSTTMGPREGRRGFPCSWARKDIEEPARVMQVLHCWHGISVARDMGWISKSQLADPDAAESACKWVASMVGIYDAAWLVPGKFMVCADPITTLLDPNPQTFTALEPAGATPANGNSQEAASPFFPNPEAPPGGAGEQPPGASPDSRTSADTIDKEYDRSGRSMLDVATATDFVTFMKRGNVRLVIRTNLDNEHGMQQKSYDAATFKPYGLQQADIKWEDFHGGCPQRAHVARAVEASRALLGSGGVEDGGAVLVHCKGGFGRSVVLACLLAVERLNVPGAAMLGWARIARPGSVNTPQQEKMLCGMRGRADVLRFAGLPVPTEDADSGGASCAGTPCTLQ